MISDGYTCKSHHNHTNMFKRLALPISHLTKTTISKFPINSIPSYPAAMQYRDLALRKTGKVTNPKCIKPHQLKHVQDEIKTQEPANITHVTQVPVKQPRDRYTTPPNPTVREWLDTASSWYEPITRPHDTSAYGLYLISAKVCHNAIVHFHRCINRMALVLGAVGDIQSCGVDFPLKFRDRIITPAQFKDMSDSRNIMGTLCTIAKFTIRSLITGSKYITIGACITSVFVFGVCFMSLLPLALIWICIWFPWVTGLVIAIVLGLVWAC